MKNFVLFSVVILGSLFFLMACQNEPECDLERPYDEINMGFYDFETLEIDTLRYDLIGTAGSDSLLYTSADTLSVFTFPLNPSADTLAYYFVTGVSIDTIQLKYDRKLEWLSERCGPFFKYQNLKIVYHTFDSVSVIQSTIDSSIDENIQVYN
ncbi:MULTISPECIES: DUF6452 family protein [Reichenbachiella]|uniref:DUF6452 family protein n=1 Tax=Reichenbachiella TaxID=156993 RepID=UPI000E6C21FE|nr:MULTISPECIES: DUF6452 family protein [Reichenbachiella]MBU2915323.1 hypothetical protein [Reichenbachiella agariperforans]RJE70545.1 hypothetical protein BGP76_10685 [Reichenbachiella sp. MSK19-1]